MSVLRTGFGNGGGIAFVVNIFVEYDYHIHNNNVFNMDRQQDLHIHEKR